MNKMKIKMFTQVILAPYQNNPARVSFDILTFVLF